MKLHVFLAICSQNKTAAISLAVLVSSVVGGSFYAGTTGGQNAIQQILQPIPQAAAQAPSTEQKMTLIPSASTEATIVIAKETSVPSIDKETTAAIIEETLQETTAAMTQETTQAAAQETTQETTQAATQAKAQVTTAAPVKAQTAAPTKAEATTPATAAAPAAMGDLSGTYNSDMAYTILDLVNQQRAAAGLPGLTWNDTLAASAKIRACEIVVSWSHKRPDGSAWYTAGSQMEMGENLAYGQTTTQQVIDEWMASSGHAENILRSSFTEMGVSCYYCNGTYYWAQHFA